MYIAGHLGKRVEAAIKEKCRVYATESGRPPCGQIPSMVHARRAMRQLFVGQTHDSY